MSQTDAIPSEDIHNKSFAPRAYVPLVSYVRELASFPEAPPPLSREVVRGPGRATGAPDRFHRYDLYRDVGRCSIPDSSCEKYPQRPYHSALMNIVWPPFCPICPPLLTLSTTAGSHPSSRMTPHGPSCWCRRALISGERGEQVEEIERKTVEREREEERETERTRKRGGGREKDRGGRG